MHRQANASGSINCLGFTLIHPRFTCGLYGQLVIAVRCNLRDLCSLWKKTVARERRRYLKFVDPATPALAPSNHLDDIVIINWVRNETIRVYPIC
jgi:hypothetical protein